MNYQKELFLKTAEEAYIHFDIFTGTDGYTDIVKDVRIGSAFNLYCFVEEGVTLPLRIMVQKQVAFNIKGQKIFRDFGEMELIVVEYSDKVYGLNISPHPIFDRLVVSCTGGVGGDTVHVLLKIL
jgi:hypothetical protein